jgi:hypothetical protein
VQHGSHKTITSAGQVLLQTNNMLAWPWVNFVEQLLRNPSVISFTVVLMYDKLLCFAAMLYRDADWWGIKRAVGCHTDPQNLTGWRRSRPGPQSRWEISFCRCFGPSWKSDAFFKPWGTLQDQYVSPTLQHNRLKLPEAPRVFAGGSR